MDKRKLFGPVLQEAAGGVLGRVTGDMSCGLLPRWRARHRFLAAPEGLDDAHGAAAAGAWLTQGEWDVLGLLFWRNGLFRLLDAKQRADLRDVGPAGRTGQQAVVPNAVKPVWEDVDQEPADELGGGQPHHLLAVPALDAIILPAEGHSIGIGADQAGVGDRPPMGIAAQVGQHRLGAAEGRLGINHPFGFAERGEPGRKGIGLSQIFEIAEEGEFACAVQVHQPLQKQAPEQP